MIYIPAEDSFLLGEYVKKFCRGKNILDMGCGSGYLAKAALMSGAKSVEGCDINEEAVKACKGKGINAFYSNLFSHVTKKYDLIVFNPPYLPLDRREDRKSKIITTGGKRGYELLERFLGQAKLHLNHNGIILIIVSSLTGDVEKIFMNNNYEYALLATKKVFFEELRVYSLERS